MGYNSFEDLEVWKRACFLAVGIRPNQIPNPKNLKLLF
jgi:hypothetical protein